ncbi:MAG TPA: hypothetical protein PK611_05700 [Saprospiraceae bacterium]|jgi:hypothetical protein|nr:hypothetical protein [Saprospiraceae bacterium]HRO09864.1 hypothetical protein [Saprospiraceae bacterium]HRO73143.1 hypothetical protein [Saprospiraceae bacterium]
MQVIHNIFYLLFTGMLIGTVSCKSVKNTAPSVRLDKPEIIFLVMNMSNDTILKKNTIRIVEKIKTEGTIKVNEQNIAETPNYLSFEMYEQGKLVHTFVREHPLYKRVEYPGDTSYESKELKLDTADFFVRLQSNTSDGKLIIYEITNNTEKNILTSIQL